MEVGISDERIMYKSTEMWKVWRTQQELEAVLVDEASGVRQG